MWDGSKNNNGGENNTFFPNKHSEAVSVHPGYDPVHYKYIVAQTVI